MKKQFKQVHRCPGGYYFRITLPVAKFQAEERWESAADAAFFVDLFKLVLVRRYKLAGNTMWPSLSPEVFAANLSEIGADRSSTDCLFDALPQSCKDFLLDGGHDELSKHRDNQAVMNRVIS